MTKKQIGKRFLQILIVLFGISFLTFGLIYLSPGDPAEIMLTECGNLPTPELLEQTRHDLALIRSFAHQIAVMYLGNIVEVIPGEDVTEHAVHPYTQALLGAQFSIHMDPNQKIQSIESEAPSPLDVPKGCPFHNRCQHCTDRCKAEMPKLKEIAPGHEAACFYVEEHLKN